EAGRGTHDLDHLDLLVARRRQYHVDRARLLFLLAGAVGASARGGGNRRRDGSRRYAELLLERFDALRQLEHRDALELVDPLLGACGHRYQSSLLEGCSADCSGVGPSAWLSSWPASASPPAWGSPPCAVGSRSCCPDAAGA